MSYFLRNEDAFAVIVAGTNPVVFTNFGDTQIWIPFVTPNTATMAFNGAGQPLITGVGPYAAPPHRHSTGVHCIYRLYPDTTGVIEIQATFAEFVIPPVNPVAGDLAGYGIMLLNSAPSTAAPIAHGHFIMGGWVNATANWQFNWTLSAALNDVNWNAQNQNSPGVGVTDFVINVRIGYTSATLTWIMNNLDFPLRFGINGGALSALVMTAAGHFGYEVERGIQFSLGYSGASRHASNTARLTEFRLITGRMAIG